MVVKAFSRDAHVLDECKVNCRQNNYSVISMWQDWTKVENEGYVIPL